MPTTTIDPIDALKLIAGLSAVDIPANSNTEPDAMADALELAKRTLAEVHGVATAAISGRVYTPPEETPGLTPLEIMQARAFRTLVRTVLATWNASDFLEIALDRDFDSDGDAFRDLCATLNSADDLSDADALRAIETLNAAD